MAAKEFADYVSAAATSRRDLKALKVAVVHYWLLNMRGGEKVLESILEIFPQADIYTHVYNPNRVSERIRSRKVTTTFIQKLPFARKAYQIYLPLMPVALEQLDLSQYDLVISSEAGPSKGVIVPPDTPHICYCHSPMRYIWDQYHVYRKQAGRIKRYAMYALMSSIRQWDVTSAARVDQFVANSNAVADRIYRYWHRTADVIAPPVEVDRFSATEPREDFYLHVGEFVPYKRVDLAIAACNALKRRLVIIGNGPEIQALKSIAGPTIEFLGRVPDDILAEHYSRCKALLFPAEEDFGIVPIEAMASGAPVIAFAKGGARDYVREGRTGLFFNHQTTESLVDAIEKFEAVESQFNPVAIADFARRNFSKDLFKQKFTTAVLRVMDQHYKRTHNGNETLTHLPVLANDERPEPFAIAERAPSRMEKGG